MTIDHYFLSVLKFDALLFQQADAAVDDGLVEFEIGDAVAQQSTCGFVFLEDGNGVAHVVEVVGGGETGGTGSDDGHLLSVTLDVGTGHDKTFLKGHLGDGGLVLAVSGRLVVEAVEHAGLLAQRRADAASELGEGICAIQQAVGQLKVAFVQSVVPLGRLVAQRTGPVAEGHAAVHAAAGLQFAFARRERLLHLAEVVDSIVNRTVTRLLAVYL